MADTTTNPTENTIDALLTRIARAKLGFTTLETRNSDSLDFRDVGVASLKEALRAAFDAGRAYAADRAARDGGAL